MSYIVAQNESGIAPLEQLVRYNGRSTISSNVFSSSLKIMVWSTAILVVQSAY